MLLALIFQKTKKLESTALSEEIHSFSSEVKEFSYEELWEKVGEVKMVGTQKVSVIKSNKILRKSGNA